MPRRGSARRYAEALFQLAMDQDTLDAAAQQLGQANELLQDHDLRAFLQHAKIPLQRKVETVRQLLAEAGLLVQNTLCLLVSRGLVDLTGEVEEEYRQLLNQHRSREEVEVRSAVPLEDAERERVARFVSALIDKEVVLEARVDPSILGGLVITIGDRLIDGSTRTRLTELGKQLQRNTSAAV